MSPSLGLKSLIVSFPSPQVNLSAPGPPVSTSLQLPAENKVSLPLLATFSELHTPFSVVTLSLTNELPSVLLLLIEDIILLLDIVNWFELRLELLKIPELESSKVLLLFNAFDIKFCILDSRLSENWVVEEEFIELD